MPPPPRRKLCPLYRSAGKPSSDRLWRNLLTNLAWVRTTSKPLSKYLNRGAGLFPVGQDRQRPSKAFEGQNRECFNLGKGILKVRSRNCMTLDQRTVKTAHHSEIPHQMHKSDDWGQMTLCFVLTSWISGKRNKIPKMHVVQKTLSKEEDISNLHAIMLRMSKVIGNF